MRQEAGSRHFEYARCSRTPFNVANQPLCSLAKSSLSRIFCVCMCMLKKTRRDCRVNTTLCLSADKQGLVCDGGRRNACGSRHAPLRGHASPTWFLHYVSLDLDGHDNWYCDNTGAGDDNDDDDDNKSAKRRHNAFTFVGSYYYVYAKLASCRAPTGQVSQTLTSLPSSTFIQFVTQMRLTFVQ